MDDEELLYNKVREWALKQLYVSCSAIQREFGLGFNRSMRQFNRLVEEGIISRTRTDEFGNRVICHTEQKEDK